MPVESVSLHKAKRNEEYGPFLLARHYMKVQIMKSSALGTSLADSTHHSGINVKEQPGGSGDVLDDAYTFVYVL